MDVNAKNPQGVNVIFFAIIHNHKDIVQLLINRGANVNDQFSITEHDNECITYTPVTSVFINGLHESNTRDVIDILKLLLKAGANPDTICTLKNENTNDITAVSVLKHASPKILFLLLTFGAELKNEDLAIIREKDDLQNCYRAFKEIEAMPNLSRLIKTYRNQDKKENAKVIASYINNEANGQELSATRKS